MRLRGLGIGVLMLIVLAAAILMPRVGALGRFVTPDEYKWLNRSANFNSALSQGEYAYTYQREHPGVTTRWLGAAALLWRFPEYGRVGTPQASVDDYERVIAERGYELIDLLVASRFSMIFAHTVLLLLAFFFARRSLGPVPAFVGMLFIAFDPFHIAHSRVFHLDGLLSSLLLLALLAFLNFLSERRLSALIISGVAAGLSFLTKSPGFFLLPAVGLIALLDLVQRLIARSGGRPARLVWQAAWPLLVWGGIGAAVFALLWPAMWVDPVGTLTKMITKAFSYASAGHGGPLFFDGEVASDGNLGVSFYQFYPATYLWRTTPIILVGLLAAAAAYVLRRKPHDQPSARQMVLGLVLFALVFTGAMTLGSKKFDRYVLAVYPPLDLVAATGWVALAHGLGTRRFPLLKRYGVPVLLGVCVAVQAVMTLWTYPYYLSYYNPLLGGSRRAPEVMMIGWGEGIDEAARYLNEKPGASELTVAAWYRNQFASGFRGTSLRIPIRPKLSDAGVQAVLDLDYAVIYIHEWQRQAPRQLLERLATVTPEHSIWINGLEYVRIYNLNATPELRSIHFAAGADVLAPGSCTWLRWDVDNVREVYVDGEGVVGHDQRLVCPTAATIYELRVIHVDGSVTNKTVQIAVQE
ncbi:MAG TPA: glycosyltransferase family 39 protein [Anaerolineae bacterium]|nr:glycosyltransferase family 39 protein [Anaerolineae bacterium]